MAEFKRKIEEASFDDDEVKVTTEQLSYESAEDLLPEIMGIIAHVIESAAPLLATGEVKLDDNIAKLAPILPAIASQIGGGKLKRLVPLILASTTVTMPDPSEPSEKIQLSLINKADRALMFEARPHLYFQIIFFAGRVTFGRFFPASGRRAKKAPTPPTAST